MSRFHHSATRSPGSARRSPERGCRGSRKERTRDERSREEKRAHVYSEILPSPVNPRISRSSALVAVALTALVARAIFELSGSQYDSWVLALGIMAALLAVAALLVFVGVLDTALGHVRMSIALSAATVVIVLAALTTKLYSDGSPHYPYWPHALAWISLAVFTVGLVASLSTRSKSRR
jgi:hypothetical protein